MERPKRTDTEDDIIKMQKEFLDSKAKGKVFQPAAQVIKVEKEKKQSLFAQKRKQEAAANVITGNSEPPPKAPALGEIIEKDLEMPTELKHYVVGDIIERSSAAPMEMEWSEKHFTSFPEVEKLDSYDESPIPGKSLYAMAMEKKLKIKLNENDETKTMQSQSSASQSVFGETSTLVKDTKAAKSIHDDNVEILSKMSEEEILAERANLLKCLDSQVLDFIKAQKNKIKPDTDACVEAVKKVMKKSSSLESRAKKTDGKVKFSETLIVNHENQKEDSIMEEIEKIPSVSDVLMSNESENWVNFNVVEKEKLEWMKDIPNMIKNIKPGESFEARFDWKGVLLPYMDKDQIKDDRELYMHGNEPSRPGYTLQELFRLSGSNIIQQRCSALSSICGIISIYNQGFYDNVLEIPLTKIFFLLRYSMDKNTISLLEIATKGMASLLLNDSDETVLDFIFETSEGFLQPVIETNKSLEINNEPNENLDKQLKNLKLSKSPFTADVADEEGESKASMTDFELAENDLIECLLRTNIIQRIYYILNTIRPENSTVTSCLKILIRLARTNAETAKQIISHEELIKLLIKEFLPGLHKIDLNEVSKVYSYPQYQVLKLFRIIMSQKLSLCIKLLSYDLLDIIKNFLHSREDIKGHIIKVQIESLRIIRVIMRLKPDLSIYKSLLPAFRYMLEWHYQHLVYEDGGPYLIRQHASAVLEAISSGPYYEAKTALQDPIEMCCSKWFHTATIFGIKEFSQSNLLSSCISCVNWALQQNDSCFKEFLEKYLKNFISSKSFIEYGKTLEYSSIILKYDSDDRRSVFPSLSNLGTVLISPNGPQLIISQVFSIYFLNNIFKLTETLVQQRKDVLMLCLLKVDVIEILVNYLKNIGLKVNKKLGTNFVAKSELKLIYKLICFEGFREFLTKTELLQASFNLIKCMSAEHIQEIEKIFRTIIFNNNFLDFESTILQNWEQIYLETFIYPHSIVISPTEMSLSLPCFPEPILPNDWPYMLLKSLLNKYLQLSTNQVVEKEKDFPESEIIKITLTFTSLLESNNLEITSPTEKLMYLMIAFMGPDAIFLEPEMKALLKQHIDCFFENNINTMFDFGGTFEGKSKYENLYVLFLDHFQAASYGDALFSSLVMIPLAQKYDPKWRKMVWSEHVAVLRFLNCEETQLLGSLSAYLEPNETDISVLKCYAQALNSNLLRKDTIPHRIASHHLNQYKMKHK